MDPDEYEREMQRLRDERIAEAMAKLKASNVRKVRRRE